MAKFGDGGDLVKCSFCGKAQKQVRKLIAGPGVYICDECVVHCVDIIAEKVTGPDRDSQQVPGTHQIARNDLLGLLGRQVRIESAKVAELPGRNGTKCSFCGKGNEQVRKLIAGPLVYICDECVVQCVDIIAEELTGLDHELLGRQVRIESATAAELQGRIGTVVAVGNDETLLVECSFDDGSTKATVLRPGGWAPLD